MKAKKSDRIDGVFLVPYFHDMDQRGSFSKFFSDNKIYIDSTGIDFTVKEVFVSNSKQNVIRGMHIQVEPFASSKIVIPLIGEVLDVLIDLRIHSRSYLNVQEIKLVSSQRKMLYVPKGVAHGFKVISNEATLLYLMDKTYHKNFDKSIMPFSFQYDWELADPIISQRDKNGIHHQDFISKEVVKT
jgi:dTDP-4-dehydrorhamnose 3,5-epimerase/CDP-3, 6-dideoxy-D-glycero-D-glycero-4-hexulose-5-epimerase